MDVRVLRERSLTQCLESKIKLTRSAFNLRYNPLGGSPPPVQRRSAHLDGHELTIEWPLAVVPMLKAEKPL